MELDNTQKKFIVEVDQKVKWLKSLGYADNSVLAHCQTFLPPLSQYSSMHQKRSWICISML